MPIFRRTNRRTLRLWSLLLCVSLLCSSGVILHVHSLDNGHDGYPDHADVVAEADDFAHSSQAHYAYGASHGDHHDAVSEFDASPEGALKNLSGKVLALALLALLFAWILPVSSRQVVYRHRHISPAIRGHYLLSPPLRAPPAHF